MEPLQLLNSEDLLLNQARSGKLKFAIRFHDAIKRGPHFDLVIGNPNELFCADFVIPKPKSLDIIGINGRGNLAIALEPHPTDPTKIWNLVCRRPKDIEERYINQTDFFFKLTNFYKDYDIEMENVKKKRKEFDEFDYEIGLIVKKRGEYFYRRINGNDLYKIIKKILFSDENVIVEKIRRRDHIFVITVKFE